MVNRPMALSLWTNDGARNRYSAGILLAVEVQLVTGQLEA